MSESVKRGGEESAMAGPRSRIATAVLEFHDRFALPINDSTRTTNTLRADLILEEAREAAEAFRYRAQAADHG